MVLASIWEGVGTVWGLFGPLLGDFCSILWTFNIELFSSMAPRWAPRGLLGRVWEGLGRIWGGFGEGLGRNLEGFERFGAGCGQILRAFGKMWPCCGKAYKLDPRADPRSVTMRGGPSPPRVR